MDNTYGPNIENVRCLVSQGTNIYAGTNGAGVYLSSDNGLSWKSINTGLTNFHISSMAVIGDMVFAGTTSYFQLINGDGVFASSDSGKHWSPVNNGIISGSRGLEIEALVSNGGTELYAGTFEKGLFRSIDSAKTWMPVNGFPHGCCVTISALASFGTKVFVGFNGDGGCYSSNSGSQWSIFHYPNDAFDKIVKSLVVNSTKIFVGTGGTNPLYSANTSGGYSSIVNTSLPTHATTMSLASNGTNVLAGTSIGKISLSTSSGLNWKDFSDGLGNGMVRALLITGDYCYAAQGLTVWKRSLNDFYVNATDFSSGKSLFVFPNPTQDHLTIKSDARIEAIEVFNVLGEAVSKSHVVNRKSEIEQDVSFLNPGIYFLKLQTKEGSVVKRFVKE